MSDTPSTELAVLLMAHRRVETGGRVWCTCGKLLWQSGTGFTAGKIEMLPGLHTVSDTAHVDHLAKVLAAHDRKVRAEALKPFHELFALRPDSPCRTTWHDGDEYIEVPFTDLAAAFPDADDPAYSVGTELA